MGKKKRRNSFERTFRKLSRKRDLVVAWLGENGIEVPEGSTDRRIIELAYKQAGWELKSKTVTVAGAHGHYSNIRHAIEKPPSNVVPFSARDVSVERARKFYESYEWRKARYQVLQRDNQECLLCGATREDGVKLHVDHIKPLRKFWDLRLDPSNLQTLCEICNHGKGNWDETDWRAQSIGLTK